MAELTVRFDLSFGTRSLRCLMAAGMIFSAAPELASESVTLTTYYPAPSGVYTQMITTGNTFLSRDGACVAGNLNSCVGIGTTNPQNKLDVSGSAAIGTYAGNNIGPSNGLIVSGTVGIGMSSPNPAAALNVTGDVALVGASGSGYPGGTLGRLTIGGTGGSYSAIEAQSGKLTIGGGAWATVAIPSGNVGIGTTNPVYGLDVRTTLNVTGVLLAAGSCVLTPWANGVVTCPANQYATNVSGVMAQYVAEGNDPAQGVGTGGTTSNYTPSDMVTDTTGEMLCCPCPLTTSGSSVCPSL